MKKIPLPSAVYAGIYLKTNGFHISITHNRKSIKESLFVPTGTNLVATILAWLREYNDTNNTIFVAIAVSSNGRKAILASKFWLQLDTVAFHYPNSTDDPEKTTKRT